jgi:hypothetical protein
MPFEVFHRQRAPLVLQPYVTIQKKGIISINEAAHAALQSPKAVELLYDREAKIMALRAADPETEHAYAVRPNGTAAKSYLIAGTAFTKYYGISTGVARRWAAQLQMGSDGKILVVNLNVPGTVITSNRSRGDEGKARQPQLLEDGPELARAPVEGSGASGFRA